MKRVARLVIGWSLVSLVGWGSTTISIPQDKKSEEAITLSTDLIVLDAQVVSKKTRLAVPGLGKDDFALYEDGAKQYISYFSQNSLPLSIVILLDVSSSIASNFDRLQSAATEALTRLKETDEAALMVFGGSARVIQEFTSNKQLISDAIRAADGTGLQRGTDINDGLYQAAAHLESASAPHRRRVIIDITDDTTSLNIVSPRPDSSVLRKLHETQAVVCGLIFYNPYKRLLIGNNASVRTCADVTGGVVVSADSKKLEANLTKIVEHLRTRYSLGYVSSNEKRDGTFRKIKLELTQAAVQRVGETAVATRKGYYALRSARPLTAGRLVYSPDRPAFPVIVREALRLVHSAEGHLHRLVDLHISRVAVGHHQVDTSATFEINHAHYARWIRVGV